MADFKSESVADFIPESLADLLRNQHLSATGPIPVANPPLTPEME